MSVHVTNDLDERMLVVGAVRYYHGRHTIGVHGFVDWLKGVWPELSEATQFCIKRDTREWIESVERVGIDKFPFGELDIAPWRDVLELGGGDVWKEGGDD